VKSHGVFKNGKLLPRLDAAITACWFFLFNGKMHLMNWTLKGKSAPFKKPEELQLNEPLAPLTLTVSPPWLSLRFELTRSALLRAL
jgi:hypothetical protein